MASRGRNEGKGIEMSTHAETTPSVELVAGERTSLLDGAPAAIRSVHHHASTTSNSSSNVVVPRADVRVPDTSRSAFSDAVRDACYFSFGVVAVDVWILDGQSQSFVHAEPGGWYCAPTFVPRSSEALARIEDSTRPDYVPPTPQVPGAGLAGYFWKVRSTTRDGRCRWKQLRSITTDPFQPSYPRMKMLEEAGFGKAAGVPFDIRGHRGVVLYLARASADDGTLREEANDTYLRTAADLLGSLFAIETARRRSVEAKAKRRDVSIHRAFTAFRAVRAFASRESLNEDDDKESLRRRRRTRSRHKQPQLLRASTYGRAYEQFLLRAHVFASKCRSGGQIQTPSRMGASEMRWTFVGAFVTFTVLSATKNVIYKWTGEQMILGPFGAFVCLQHALTQAPPAQPRDAIYGQAVSFMVTMAAKGAAVRLGVPSWLHAPLGTSLAVTAMAGLGVTHPPAGAMSWIIASEGDFRPFIDLDVGIAFALCLLGNSIAIVIATVVNNLNDRRQYPIYWHWR